jgi:N6-L-threonylcarbamoyladenine synthase
VDGFGRYKELGRTRDDAAGEAYDKVGKLLGLGYPGGPAIDSRAQQGNPESVDFPRPFLPDSLDFSFSGLKTAVANYLKYGHPVSVNDICASFQQSVVDVLVKKTEWALRRERIKRLAVSGGVAANSGLRRALGRLAAEKEAEVFIPPLQLCTDNAAMIAAAGYHHYMIRDTVGLDLNPIAYLPL